MGYSTSVEELRQIAPKGIISAVGQFRLCLRGTALRSRPLRISAFRFLVFRYGIAVDGAALRWGC